MCGRLKWLGALSEDYTHPLHRGIGGSMYTRKAYATREAPRPESRDLLPNAIEKRSLADTAQALSFFIQVKFTQAFKQATGQTPINIVKRINSNK
jgi:hypothetical protein